MGIKIKINGVFKNSPTGELDFNNFPIHENLVFDDVNVYQNEVHGIIDGSVVDITHRPDDDTRIFEFEDEDGNPVEIEEQESPATEQEKQDALLLLAANTLGLQQDNIEQLANATSIVATAIGVQSSPTGNWQPDEYVAVGDKRTHNSQSYICRQAHVTQADWTPDIVPALWEKEKPTGVTEWERPAAGTWGYMKGDIVTHNGKTWESVIDYNTYEPGVVGATIWAEVAV